MKNFAILLSIIAFLVIMMSSCSESQPTIKAAGSVDSIIIARNEILNEKVLAKVHSWPIRVDEEFISELKWVHPAFVAGDIVTLGGVHSTYMIDSIIVLDTEGHYTGDLNILDDDN